MFKLNTRISDQFNKNWFKALSVLITILVIIVIFYFIKREQNIQAKLARDSYVYKQQQNCQDLGAKRKEEVRKVDNPTSIIQFVFKYNTTTERCVLAYVTYNDIFTPGSQWGTSYLIEDLFTGENLYVARISAASHDDTRGSEDFKEKSDFYFNQ